MILCVLLLKLLLNICCADDINTASIVTLDIIMSFSYETELNKFIYQQIST